ncbi:hypothetical protein QBC47DRAFT_357433 [Echria macrotheca]|uniref:Mid2 domain-containing protein n=1 Tax=Echria macrotheca TaxID=438768 RepID=A0AAJ0FDQ7_9PEZI|nr:hypothetical protein QBC47DRAFT_357433 [Echria macrotheca]
MLRHRNGDTLVVVVVAALLSFLAQADPRATCYYPDQTVAGGFYPCIAYDAAYSACCPAGWSCFSNALCIATTPSPTYPNLTYGAVQRAACTAPQWANNVCGSICLDKDNNNGHLIYCGIDRFCCEHDFNTGKCSCDANGNATVIRPGVFQTIIFVSDATFTGTPSISIATTSANVRPTTSSRVTTTTADTPSSATASPTGTADPGNQGPSPSPSPDNNGNRNLIIGVVVGVVGGLLLLGAIGFFAWRWRRNRPIDDGEPTVVGMKPLGHGTSAATTASSVAPHIDDDLRENDPDGARFVNDYGRPRRVDI